MEKVVIKLSNQANEFTLQRLQLYFYNNGYMNGNFIII